MIYPSSRDSPGESSEQSSKSITSKCLREDDAVVVIFGIVIFAVVTVALVILVVVVVFVVVVVVAFNRGNLTQTLRLNLAYMKAEATTRPQWVRSHRIDFLPA